MVFDHVRLDSHTNDSRTTIEIDLLRLQESIRTVVELTSVSLSLYDERHKLRAVSGEHGKDIVGRTLDQTLYLERAYGLW